MFVKVDSGNRFEVHPKWPGKPGLYMCYPVSLCELPFNIYPKLKNTFHFSFTNLQCIFVFEQGETFNVTD